MFVTVQGIRFYLQIIAQKRRPFIKRRPQEGEVRNRALIRADSQRGREYVLLATYGWTLREVTLCNKMQKARDSYKSLTMLLSPPWDHSPKMRIDFYRIYLQSRDNGQVLLFVLLSCTLRTVQSGLLILNSSRMKCAQFLFFLTQAGTLGSMPTWRHFL